MVTLDEKDDQKIFQDDPSLQRMRRLILGERRGPGSITCWDTRNSKDHGATCSPIANSWLILEGSNDKNTGAIGWQDRDDDLEGWA